MTRLALYRKYRSATLDDVIGQDHVVQTLKGAIDKGNIAHAYLFCGPRGVGKTSVARIVARLVNGLSGETELAGELDIIEIDAASNRGIDEIRNLRDKISVAPTKLRYKVYIIDEVHMLTSSAFNALLKTLEEPPPHAIFVLATTEVHKLPDTVISRTQRFDFRPIGLLDLTKRLGVIAKNEKIAITPEAITVIAQRSRGGFRDAISLLDQLSSFDKKIDSAVISNILGISSVEQLEKLTIAVATGHTRQALDLVGELIAAGTEPLMLTRELAEFSRVNLLEKVSAAEPSSRLAEVSEACLARLLDNLTKAQADFKITQHYSLPLELAIYKSASSTPTANQPTVQKVQPFKSEFNNNNSTAEKNDSRQSAQVSASSNNDDDNLCLKGLSLIKQRNNSLYAVMRSANPVLSSDKITLSCRFSFHKERIEEPKNRQLIEAVMSKVTGRTITLACSAQSSASDKSEVKDIDDELVSSALEILGGEVV